MSKGIYKMDINKMAWIVIFISSIMVARCEHPNFKIEEGSFDQFEIIKTFNENSITAIPKCFKRCEKIDGCTQSATDFDSKEPSKPFKCYLLKESNTPNKPMHIKLIHRINVATEKVIRDETCSERTIESNETEWYLGMNLNPSDGHLMDYYTGWAEDKDIGTYDSAFAKDYLNATVWKMPVDYIAIIRHQEGIMEAVKVWKFTKAKISMLDRFKGADREIITEGSPQQVCIPSNMPNNFDDPIFSVSGEIAINWLYDDNAHRVVLTGGYLGKKDDNDDNTHGFSNNLANHNIDWANEISTIQDCPLPHCSASNVKIQGTDHGKGLQSGPIYGSYAIFVSPSSKRFLIQGNKLSHKPKSG